MPELTSIQLGYNAFSFDNHDSTELIMRSDPLYYMLRIDLPELTLLYENNDEYWYTGGAFINARLITIEGHSQQVL